MGKEIIQSFRPMETIQAQRARNACEELKSLRSWSFLCCSKEVGPP
jgi:hypothetical protein